MKADDNDSGAAKAVGAQRSEQESEHGAAATAAPAAGAYRGGIDAPPRWVQRLGFWRAVAGMALTVAIACAIVAAESVSDLYHRSAHYQHRLSQLTTELKRVRQNIVAADQRLKQMRDEGLERETLNRILAAPDARMIRFDPPGARDNKSLSHATGVVVMSPAMGQAIFEGKGMTALSGDQIYELWWILKRHGAVKAGTFAADGADGRALAVLTAPARDDVLAGAVVTAENAQGAIEPSARVELKAPRSPRETAR